MKKATVVIATTLGLVTTAMGVSIAWRDMTDADSVTTLDAPTSFDAAGADASPAPPPQPEASSAAAARDIPDQLPPAHPDARSDWTFLAAETRSPKAAPMRDASPEPPDTADVAPQPLAKVDVAVAKIDAAVSKMIDPETLAVGRSLFAIPQGAAATPSARPPTPGDEIEMPASDSQSAVVKPALAKPASKKSGTEKAADDKPADATGAVTPSEAPVSEKQPVAARAETVEHHGRETGHARKASAHAIGPVKWRGWDGASLRFGANAHGFAASFGGCRYRGAIWGGVYRIEGSC